MKSAFKVRAPRYPVSWDAFPAGALIRSATEAVCNELSQRIFGYHFVKLGNLSCELSLPDCSVRQHIHQCQQTSAIAGVIAHSHVLPYVENSIDGFLLSHELDFAQDPHEILREVDRTITENGYVIITGFNPFSIDGIAKYLPIKRENILHDARFFSSSRVKDWLQLLGFEIVEQHYIVNSMLLFTGNRLMTTKVREWMNRHCKYLSSTYVILARKRTYPMTKIRSGAKLKPRFSAVGATMRNNTSL